MSTYFSPAKLNLFFRVLRRRKDGFHEISSLMGAISLGDHLSFSLASQDHLECNDFTIPLGDDNLIWKAVHLFRRETGNNSPLHIKLNKRIPAQAGLGGGSSNAATTLFALNDLFERPFSHDRLLELGGQIGSDVPFFFSSGFALSQGRGEKITSLPSLVLPPCTVAKPQDASLSTPSVYKETRVDELTPSEKIPFFNDLEPASFRLLPKLKTLKEDLLSLGFTQVVMTGSGTAFFCFGDVSSPSLPNVSFFKVDFLQRSPLSWWDPKCDSRIGF